MLATVTGLPLLQLSAGAGRIWRSGLSVHSRLSGARICYGRRWKALRGVLPRRFALRNFIRCSAVSGFKLHRCLELTDILASLTAVGCLIILLRVWAPKDDFQLEGDGPPHPRSTIPVGRIFAAWTPFALLVVCVLVWGLKPVQAELAHASLKFPRPGLHRLITRMPPVAVKVPLSTTPSTRSVGCPPPALRALWRQRCSPFWSQA